MKKTIRKASIAVSGIVLVLVIFSVGRSYMVRPQVQVVEYSEFRQLESIIATRLGEEIAETQLYNQVHFLQETMRAGSFEQMGIPDTSYAEIEGFVSQQAISERTRDEVNQIVRAEFDAVESNLLQQQNDWNTNNIKLLAKLLFSLIFGLSALYVVLSNKYPEDTQKWAFSILSLIAGVWIGSL